MSISKRKDGRWIVKYKATDGRWRQRSFCSEDDASQFEAECQYDKTEDSRLTVLEAVLVFLKNNTRIRSQTTIDRYQYIVCGYDQATHRHTEGPAEFLATRYVDTLTRRDLEMVRERCRERNNAVVTINKITGMLNTAFNWCVEQDLLPENPWAKYKRVPGYKPKSRTGSLEDFRKVYPLLPPWMQWAARTAIALCLRPGISELFRLQWSAFNWRDGSVTVYMPKVDREKIVYPPDWYMKEAWPRYQQDQASGYELVCRTKKDRPVNKSEYKRSWRTAREKAGVKMSMYALRHIAATEMLAAGADLAAVAAQLGHKNIATTGSFYIHALASAQRRAAKTLPGASLVQIGAGIEYENK